MGLRYKLYVIDIPSRSQSTLRKCFGSCSNFSNNLLHTQYFPKLMEVWLTYPQLKSKLPKDLVRILSLINPPHQRYYSQQTDGFCDFSDLASRRVISCYSVSLSPKIPLSFFHVKVPQSAWITLALPERSFENILPKQLRPWELPVLFAQRFLRDCQYYVCHLGGGKFKKDPGSKK